jgi:hypothetical protein
LRQRLPIDATIAHCGALGLFDAASIAGGANSYLVLQQDFAELFAGQLPDDAFHLHVKERSQNLGRVQAYAFPRGTAPFAWHRASGADDAEARQIKNL